MKRYLRYQWGRTFSRRKWHLVRDTQHVALCGAKIVWERADGPSPPLETQCRHCLKEARIVSYEERYLILRTNLIRLMNDRDS